MKRFLTTVSLAAMLLAGSSCSEEQMALVQDAQKLVDEYKGLKEEVDALKTQMANLNTDVANLQSIVTELKGRGYITAVEELKEGGETVGYSITFNDGRTITIRNGANGDGSSPQISVREDADGIWYWTLNGDWLLDNDGNRVPASGKDGTNGQDGITPLLKIENDYWYISYDKGTTWTKLDKASGVGDSFFQTIDLSNPNYVVFTMADGSKFQVPRYKPVSIGFNIQGGKTTIGAGETISIEYTLENATDGTKVSASSDGNYIVKVKAQASKGTIYVTAPSKYENGYVNVLVDNGIGYVSLTVINFSEREITFTNGYNYNVAATGGTVNVPLTSNFDYEVVVDQAAASWITVVQSKATFGGTIILSVATNGSYQARVGKVYLKPTNGNGTFRKEILINQASAVFSMSRGGFVLAKEAGKASMTVTSTRGLVVSIPASADWIRADVTQPAAGSNTYGIDFVYEENLGTTFRGCDVSFCASDGTTVLGVIGIVQTARDADDLNAMIFKVRANYANDYTVCLPIGSRASYSYQDENGMWQYINRDTDCYVDWGDGTVEHIDQNFFNTAGGTGMYNSYVSHNYADTGTGQMYIVTIRGSVPDLYGNNIPESYRSGIRQVVQWGNTGLISMNYAFVGCSKLEFLASDETRAFEEVRTIHYAFSNCTTLETVPADLLVACGNITQYDGLFSGCTMLNEVPEQLFAYSPKVTSFDYTFSKCTALAVVPEKLFAPCPLVTRFDYTFAGCSMLVTVPEGIFAANPEVTSFSSVFSRSGIVTVPEKVFWGNPKVTDFSYAFNECQQLKSIPGRLLLYCPDITSVYAMFQRCSSLRSIPVNLFDENRRIVDFSWTFNGCYGINYNTQETPYRRIKDRDYHLYERGFDEDDFVAPLRYENCFGAISEQFSDRLKIPKSWGGNGNELNYKVDPGEPDGFKYDDWN